MAGRQYAPRAQAEDDDCDDEQGQRGSLVSDNSRNGANDEEDVTNNRDDDCNADGLVASPIAVGHVSSQNRSQIHVEGQESFETQDLFQLGWYHVRPEDTRQDLLVKPVLACCPMPRAPDCPSAPPAPVLLPGRGHLQMDGQFSKRFFFKECRHHLFDQSAKY